MTRDSNTISAVFMAVVLVLASGAAVSFAATADAGPNAVGVQDTTTEDGADETTTADDEQDGEQASVTFDDQESDGERLVLDSVTLPEGGFVAIHSENWEDAPLSTVLGSSAYLEAGTHEDVEISLARPLDETQTVTAMLHVDTNDNRVLDFVLSSGALDGPVTADGSPVVDDAEVTVGDETTTEVSDETTTEDGVETVTTTEAEEVDNETTTEDDVETETTTEEDDVETVTTTEAEEVVDETTTEEDVGTETPTDGMQQLVFKIEEMAIDRWSFVVGDEETPDETVYVNGSDLLPPDGSLTDERVTVDLAELAEQGEVSQDDLMYTTTQSPEEIEQDVEESLSGDIPTVRYVIQDVNVENVTLVVMVPEDVELPDQPTVEEPTTTEEDVETMTTTEEEVDETTTEEDVADETTTEEDVVDETTTEEDVVETTTEEDVVDETTTEEDVVDETTTEEDVETVTTTEEDVVETTTEEDVVDETTTEEDEVTETTTEVDEPAEEVDSFEVAELDAPESATVGDTIDVSATVTNPNEEEATQTVAFRLEGDVIAREDVTLAEGESSTVSFGVDTSEVPPGEYVHGVYTMEFGELDVIVLEEAADEGDDEATDGETTVGDEMETTTTAAE